MLIEAHAKINWTLEVLGKRSDGYHELRSVVLPVPLHDILEIEPAEEVSCITIGADVPQESNLAYKAAIALKRATGCAAGASIKIEKRIPMGAGLGGGSADAAAVLNGLNGLWNLKLSKEDLCAIAAGVGSDVPALALGGMVLMEGRGERVSRHNPAAVEKTVWENVCRAAERNVPDANRIEILTPPVFASTPKVYAEFRMSDCGLCRNDLQGAATRLYPEILDAMRELEARGLSDVAMSGSGSSVYGVRT